MLSGMLRTSCMTTPLSSRRFCSLFRSAANKVAAARVIHAAPINTRFIGDLHGRNIFFECSTRLRRVVERSSYRIDSREGDALPDSQAGHLLSFRLGIFSGSRDEHDDPPEQCQSTEDGRNGNMFLLIRCGVNRANVQYFFPMGVIEALVGQCQGAKNNQQNSKHHCRFHIIRLPSQAVPLRPDTRLKIRMTTAATNRMWMSPPAV